MLIVPIEFNDEAVVKEDNDVTAVFTSVPVVGSVTFVGAVVVSVKLLAPEVINEELSASVRVAEVVGAVIVILLYVDAEAFPFAKITPDIDEEEPVAVNKLPPIPTPPVTTNAPEFVPILTAELVILVVPPIKAFPAIPIPPAKVTDPEFVPLEDWVLV